MLILWECELKDKALPQKLRSFLSKEIYLTIEDIWIPLGESLLIRSFRPLWNLELAGFGNHNPGAGRYEGKIPLWDIIHPGREWAPNLKPRPNTKPELEERARIFLAKNEPPDDPRLRFKAGGKIDDGLV